MNKILFFGGSGGLGTKLSPLLENITGRHGEKQLYLNEVVSLNSQTDIRQEKLVKLAIDKFKPNVILIASAINIDGVIHKITEENLTSQIDTNIKGLTYILKHATPLFRENGSGSIISFSSILSQKPLIGTAVYNSCKAFMDNMIKTYALENIKYNITANTIQMGYFDGGIFYDIPEDIQAKIIEKIPAKRLGTIQELANTIQFLIETPYVTGTTLQISGGLNI